MGVVQRLSAQSRADTATTPSRSFEDTDASRRIAEDILLRRLLVAQSDTILGLSEAIGIPMALGQEITEMLRERQFATYEGMEGRDYRVALTEKGRNLAIERERLCSYAGRLPVSLAEYTAVVQRQVGVHAVNRESIKRAFGDLVLEDGMVDQIGPAFLSNSALLLYGPPGTGKTSIAERLGRLFGDAVAIPHAVEVDGQIITVYEPSIHRRVEELAPSEDPRWVVCHRPVVMVGGELTMDMFDLNFIDRSGFYSAPLQMQANNGILVVDDFGRQRPTPTELLNRWIVPLSRNIDFLKLVNGNSLTVPFAVKLVTSTNLDPSSLGDEAFLRRLRNKIFVGPCSPETFTWILARAAQSHGVEITTAAAHHLRQLAMRELGGLRPYVAVDFCEMMSGIASFEGGARTLDEAMIDRVASLYFLQDDHPSDFVPMAMPPAVEPATGMDRAIDQVSTSELPIQG